MQEIAKDLVGITTTLGVIEKPGLKIASARLAVTEYQRRLDAADLPPGWDGWKLVNELWGGRRDRGTDGHTIAELVAIQYAHDPARLTDAFIAEMLAAQPALASDDVYMIGLAVRDWFLRTQPQVLATERAVACVTCGYAATEDLELVIGDELWIVDQKCSKDLYPENRLQVVGQIHARDNTLSNWKLSRRDYRGAHRYTIHGTANGPLPHVVRQTERAGLLWVSPNARDGCELVPVKNDLAELTAFWNCLALWRWVRANNRW